MAGEEHAHTDTYTTPPGALTPRYVRPEREVPTLRSLTTRRSEPTTLPPSEIDLTPGTLLAGHYQLDRTLGRGGMGVVVQAHDVQLDRKVAIKVIRPELLQNREAREDFLHEARAMARVRHANVVDVDYFGMQGRAPYFVMEYVEGRTVDQWLASSRRQRGGLPPVDEALGLIYQCCRGVTAIHDAGTTHGDLKPSNLLLSHDLRLVITDLGLARILDGGNLAHVAGTPAYMAPEALEPTHDPELAKRRDVYSLGVIAYELLTGRLPHDICDADAFYEADWTPPTEPSRLRHDLPTSMDAPLLRALALDPAERTPDAETFRNDLARARREGGQGSRDATILLVDDDHEFLRTLDRLLKRSYPTSQRVTLSSGTDALKTVERQRFDLAILDLRIPDVNGVALTAAIRSIDPTHRTAILVITAEGSAADWRLLHELGADAFLVKPFDPEALASEVQRLLAARGLGLRIGTP